VHPALATMKQHRVRRLPVEGFGGTVLGIISMNDILLAAGARKPVRDAEVVETLQAICAHHHPTPHIAAA
jgi:CBS domain-containing protein